MPRFKTSRELLLTAHSEDEVARTLFDAVGQVDPDELKRLPPECREVVVKRHTDIHDAAVTLLQSDLRHRGEDALGELLRQLAELYAAASVRLGQIEHRRQRLE
ncbi:MAG TPA: hypothetical protein VFP44_11445 [Usitatibacter sp.]|nr:hypothetical protein [Usitatibacter sp.]